MTIVCTNELFQFSFYPISSSKITTVNSQSSKMSCVRALRVGKSGSALTEKLIWVEQAA